MKIIQPAHHTVAVKVDRWSDIMHEALELKDFTNNGNFRGYYQGAFAISHAQVSSDPKWYFVVNKELEKIFGHWCIINLEILKTGEAVTHQEACMSFPFRNEKRVPRSNMLKVKYYTPLLGFLRRRTKTFKGLPAFICQHEQDHSAARNIYGK